MGLMESRLLLEAICPHVDTLVEMFLSLTDEDLHLVADGAPVLSRSETLGSVLGYPVLLDISFLPDCAQIFTSAGLFSACVSTLQRVQWPKIVAQLHRMDLRFPGTSFPPTPYSRLDDNAAAHAMIHRKSFCTSAAELVLLLLRACLRVACEDGAWTGAITHAGALAALSGVWAGFAGALRALLGGLQPEFRSWAAGVYAVDDIMNVRLNLSSLHACRPFGTVPLPSTS
jgi:hypothetical protein